MSEIQFSENESTSIPLGPLQSRLTKLEAQRWILLKHFQNYLDKKFWLNQNLRKLKHRFIYSGHQSWQGKGPEGFHLRLWEPSTK